MPLDDQEFRRERRVAFATHASVKPASGSAGLIAEALTIDFSESGVRLRLCAEIVPGQIVDLYLHNHPEKCRVVWTESRSEEKELIAGLEFMCPLPDPRRRPVPPSSRFEPLN